MRALAAAVLVAALTGPAGLADVGGDKWEGTWRISGAVSGTLVLAPATDRSTRALAPPCDGGKVYRGGYSGSRSGTVAACARSFTLAGRRYESGKLAGGLTATWEVPVSTDGTVGAPVFRGALTGTGAGAWSGTWLRHGGVIPAAATAAAGAAVGGAAAAEAKVEAILKRNKAKCEMTWTKIEARAVGARYVVTAAVRTFGNPGKAVWNVVGSRVAPAEPLAADISIGCP